ncbi:uncharacterized protein Fot_24016 [Forsythia ovata]|uniref:Uncharacterized protein n=1 Tax=Forsythia ovata TaxID=205694 RepID=A0ABD1U513_9LAMI
MTEIFVPSTIQHGVLQRRTFRRNDAYWVMKWTVFLAFKHVVPGFGRKTALKLLKKHGSLDNLLSAAACKNLWADIHAQEALTKYADFLRRNYEVLSLKKDIDVHVEDQWLSRRDTRNDLVVLGNFVNLLRENQNLRWQNRSHAMG